MNAAVKPSFLQENVTIVVHSCDSYADLWEPFFTLLHRYWKDVPCRILLNTETRDYAFPGLNIECVHPGYRSMHQPVAYLRLHTGISAVSRRIGLFLCTGKTNPAAIRYSQKNYWQIGE